MNQKFLKYLCIPLLLVGCSQKDPYADFYKKAEDLYLEMKADEGLKILQDLKEPEGGFPPRYYKILHQIHLRRYDFLNAYKVLQKQEKLDGVSRKSARKEVLLHQLRWFVQQNSKALKYDSIKALGELNDKKSLPLIMDSFNIKSRVIKITVCYSMSLLGEEKNCIAYLKDRALYSSVSARFLSAMLLCEMKRSDLSDFYMDLLNDPDDRVRTLAVRVIGDLKIDSALKKIKSVYDFSSSASVRMVAAQTLVKLGEENYREFLQKSWEKGSLAAGLLLTELGESLILKELQLKEEQMSVEEKFSLYRSLLASNRSDVVLEKIRAILSSLVGDVEEKKMALALLYANPQVNFEDILYFQLSSPFEEVQVLAAKALIKTLSI